MYMTEGGGERTERHTERAQISQKGKNERWHNEASRAILPNNNSNLSALPSPWPLPPPPVQTKPA